MEAGDLMHILSEPKILKQTDFLFYSNRNRKRGKNMEGKLFRKLIILESP